MAEYLIQDTTLDDIADAINAKTGGSSAMTPAEMVTAIGSISGGGAELVHQQFTHTEDWTTDATGNTAAFYQTYVQNFAVGKSNGLIYASISNNNVSGNWKAIYMFRDLNLTNQTAWKRQSGFPSNTADAGAGATSFYLSAGSIIDLFFFPFGGGA